MRVFQKHVDSGPSRIVIVFGCGLIGSAVIAALSRYHYRCLRRYPAHWTDRKRRLDQFSQLADFVGTLASDSPVEIHLVWSAGTGSFASTEIDLANEREAFADTLDLFSGFSAASVAIFHFISSAGGLFEGQSLVEKTSKTSPRRPYGEMKREQEILLKTYADKPQALIRIYRPSTVYGAHRFNVRSGLVSHLVWNALRNYPTTLEINLHALRDYVYDDDVGRYVTQKIEAGSDDSQDLFYLVSGKPSSIFEVVRKVERMSGRSILYQFSDRQKNDANITFRGSLLPADWSPTALEVGLKEVLRKTKESYLLDTTV